LLLAWEVGVRTRLFPSSEAAAPSEILRHLAGLVREGDLPRHALYSVLRLLVGVVLGTIAGMCAGITLGTRYSLDFVVSPTIQFLAPIPGVVWIPVLIMVFGIGELSKVAIVSVAIFFLIYIHTFIAVRSTATEYLEVAAVYEKRSLERIRDVFLPAVAPAVFAAIRVAMAFAWVVLFAVEYAYATPREGGLGWFIANERGFGRIENEFAGVLVLGAIAFLADRGIARIERHAVQWTNTLQTTLGEATP
jgi:sulfonate transport system permease protein